ncbi:hypothetical protein OHQ89_16130 [Streptomyces canus]|uniref:hypothetical protein n=1 Tax=Streptomyces canus TaxID=58343 RepID=UPI0030E4446F
MATYHKENPDCKSKFLFVGTTGLKPLDNPQVPVAMYIDILAPETYTSIKFGTAMIYIEILIPSSPSDVKIVGHPDVNPSGAWDLWNGSSWVEAPWGKPTDKLRIRHHDVRVVSGPMNGLTHWLGVTGLPNGEALEMRAYCEATDIAADAVSCAIRIEDLKAGDRLSGYLG